MARLREGRANTARGAAHFLRETVARVRDAVGTAHGARRQRLLQPRRRRRLPQAGCPLLNHHSPAAERTPADRGDSGRGLDADPVLAAGRRGCRPTYTPFQHKEDATPVRLIVRRVKPAPGSQLALSIATTPSSAIAPGSCWSSRPTTAVTRDRERDPRPQVRRRAEPSPLGPLRRERGVARRAQPRSLDGAPRARRGNRDTRSRYFALDGSPTLPGAGLCTSRSAGPAPVGTARLRAQPDARSASRLQASRMPAHASRPSRRRPQRPRAALSDGSSLRPPPAPPGERRHARRTSPPRQASIGGFGESREGGLRA